MDRVNPSEAADLRSKRKGQRPLYAPLVRALRGGAAGREAQVLADEIYALTLQRARVLSLVVLGVDFLLFYLYDYASYAAGRWEESPFYAYGVVWRIATVVGLGIYLAADAFLRRRTPGISPAQRVLATVYVGFIIAVGATQALLGQLIISDISIYALCILSVATLLHLPNRWRWIFYLVSLALLVTGFRLTGMSTAAWAGLSTNAASIVVVAFVLERVSFSSQLRILADARTIRRKSDQVEAAYALARRELEEARDVQLALLPQEVPTLEAAEVAAHSRPATQVGGDYYDWTVLADGTLLFAIGDATGHGVRAGAMVTATKALLANLMEEDDLVEVLHKTSRTLRRVNLPKLYMALAVGRLQDRRLELAGAGMPPALVWRAATRTIERVPLKGAPLGTPLPFRYETVCLELEAGDVVALMSDGLPERRNPRGVELGYEEVGQLLQGVAGGTAAEVADRLTTAAAAWAQGAPLHDDLTVLVIRMVPAVQDPTDGRTVRRRAPSDAALAGSE